MKKILLLLSITAICIIQANSQNSVRIVCMGNSITNGKVVNGIITEMSYRFWLWEKLDSAGVNVDMVGHNPYWFGENAGSMVATPKSKYTSKVFDRDHDSYYGITSNGLLNGDGNSGWTGKPLPKFSDRLSTFTADIALLHIGTNDKDAEVNQTIANIKSTIDELRKKNPKVIVFVAKLITTWSAINSKVDQIVLDKSTSTSPVIAVDLATGFVNDPKSANTMTLDWVHPNEKGQKFMAVRWFKAIQKQIGLPTGFAEIFFPSEAIEVFPSTSSGIITLTNSENAMVNVINASGKVVKSFEVKGTTYLNLDLSDLDNGLYIININQNRNLTSKKVIITK